MLSWQQDFHSDEARRHGVLMESREHMSADGSIAYVVQRGPAGWRAWVTSGAEGVGSSSRWFETREEVVGWADGDDRRRYI